jgi:ABC-2 type transport system ATP-binding protein
MEVIADARARGAAVLVSTHLRELAVQACQDAIVLRGGSAVAALPAADMHGEAGAGVYRGLLD